MLPCHNKLVWLVINLFNDTYIILVVLFINLENNSDFMKVMSWVRKKKYQGPTEIWTRIAGFKVQSANHYTIEP